MLSISKPLTSSKVQSYYRSDYSAASSSYYMESETLRGNWHGKIAAEFGLEGQQIKAEHFDRLAEGLHPLTGERLIEWREVHQKEVPAWAAEISASSPEEAKKKLAARAKAWAEHLATIYLSASVRPFEKEFVPVDIEPATRSPRKPLAEKVRTDQQKALIAMHEEAALVYKENLAGPEGEKAREYLAKRGITPELAAEFGLGLSLNGNQLAAPLAHYGPELMDASGLFAQRAGKFYDRQRERLMFPIQSASGETIAFAGRSLDGREPKYINSPETDIYKKSEVLYNLHRAKDAASEAGKTVVVEGYTDVIAAHKAGVRNVVAACGTALTQEHAEALSRTASGVVLNLDGDAPGVKATAKSVPTMLQKGMDVSIVTFGNGADPAEVVASDGGEAYYKFFVENGAESVYAWAFRTSQAGRDMADPFEQAAAAKQAINLLQSVPAEHRERCAADFAKYLGIEIKAEEKAEKKNVAHRAGNDLTWSCPKSGSLAALVGGDERVLMAHRKGVLAGEEAAEELIQARMGGNRAPVTTGKCIIAAFEHDTARPVEGYAAPQLHAHDIFFNLTVDEAGQARSIQNHELYVCSSYLTAVYQNVYEADLRQAGYRIRRGKNHAPEIDGFTQEYLDAESPRSAEIDKEMEAKGLTGARARSIAAHSTREKKLNLSPEEVKAMHLAHAEMYGNQAQRIVAEARMQAAKEMTPEEAAWLAQRCVNFARVKLSERSSVFDHHEVMTAALRHARGRTGIAEIKRELETQKAAGAFIEVSHIRANAPLYRYTTPELIADERTSIEKMLAGRDTVEPFKHTPEISHLNEEQKRVVEFVRDSRDQIIGIEGKAGSGKCLAPGTPVLFYGGEIGPVESVRVGDLLMGPDSKPRKVLSLAHGFDEMFRVIPRKGDPYVVNKPHILSLQMSGVGAKNRGGQIVNISVSDYLRSGKTFRKNAKGRRTGVSFPDQPVELSPYFLGLWLGDGSSDCQSIHNPEPEIREFLYGYASQFGLHLRVVKQSDTTRCPVLSISLGWRKGVKNKVGDNPVLQGLRNLGVIRNKHVPLAYKVNSEAIRLELLAGLIDTDGYLAGGYYEYSSISRELADDVAFLARSVGLCVTISAAQKGCQTGAVGTYYRLSISGHIDKIPVKVARKRAAPRRQIKDVLRTGIKVEGCGVGEYFGFELDGDGLFLLGDFTVTHNTTVLAAINEMARAEGYTTHGLAPSSKATKALKELKGAGIQAQTIQKFLMMPKEEGVKRCYILDETSMTSASQFRRLAEQMHSTDRLVVVGDVNQHDSVEAGRIFDELQQAGMSTIHLDKIVRQNDAGLLKAVEAFSDRDVRTGIDLLREQGRVVSIPHRGERFAAMAKEYVAHPAMRLVVNPDNPTRKELGTAIREERKSVGHVAKEDYSLRILAGKDVTGPDRTVAGSYEPGDEVKYNGAHKYLGIKAGEYATVTKSDHEKNEITVEFAKAGRTLTYNPEQAIGVEIYAPEIRPIAVGDRLQFTQATKALGVSNRDTGEVQELDMKNGNIRIKLDDGRVVGFNLKDYRHLDYAYVMTSHSSQSMTETAGMAHFDTGDSQIRKLVTDTAAYVATSRFTDHFTIYTDDADQLVRALSHHEQNATALSPKQVRDYREEMVA